jgi:hypothetical protein
MIKLMNSAMMPQPGKYELSALTRDQFVGILLNLIQGIQMYQVYPTSLI